MVAPDGNGQGNNLRVVHPGCEAEVEYAQNHASGPGHVVDVPLPCLKHQCSPVAVVQDRAVLVECDDHGFEVEPDAQFMDRPQCLPSVLDRPAAGQSALATVGGQARATGIAVIVRLRFGIDQDAFTKLAGQ